LFISAVPITTLAISQDYSQTGWDKGV